MKLTARDHWTVIDPSVLQFQIKPNGDLYLVTVEHELRRQKVGDSWMTLQSDVQSMTVYSDGTVYAFDSQGTPTLYSSLGPYHVLGPFVPGEPNIALDVPSDSEVQLAANFVVFPEIVYFAPGPEFPLSEEAAAAGQHTDVAYQNPGTTPHRVGPALLQSSVLLPIPDQLVIHNVSIVKVKTLDEIDPPRYVPNLGPAQLHRAQYQCFIYYDTDDGVGQVLVVFIDHDHYHMVGYDGDLR